MAAINLSRHEITSGKNKGVWLATKDPRVAEIAESIGYSVNHLEKIFLIGLWTGRMSPFPRKRERKQAKDRIRRAMFSKNKQ